LDRSVQTVDKLRQGLAVIEMIVIVDNEVRFDALVHVIVRAVLQEGNLFAAGVPG
jgi:hypothetical protein